MWKDVLFLEALDNTVFNALMYMEDRIEQPIGEREIVDMKECMDWCRMMKVRTSGQDYIWNNKQEGGDKGFWKLDRVLGDEEWVNNWPLTKVTILSEG